MTNAAFGFFQGFFFAQADDRVQLPFFVLISEKAFMTASFGDSCFDQIGDFSGIKFHDKPLWLTVFETLVYKNIVTY